MPSFSIISAPSCFRPLICKSMGRLPILHPPGDDIRPRPHRAKSPPKKIKDDRIWLTSSAGISKLFSPDESMVTTSPTKSALQPSRRKISKETKTSAIRGTPRITLIPAFKIAAASIGKTAFLLPPILISPKSGAPPRIKYSPIKTPPRIVISTHMQDGAFW
ncbi:MAG: hypothetical protein FWB71_04915 [Defluviitaleaceae bacterium]|nr:hypothetical protein [Defluviitaleaceae bacterium]